MDFVQNTSLRARILGLQVGEQITARAKRATLQNYASTIKEVTGRKFRVHKNNDNSFSVLRYE